MSASGGASSYQCKHEHQGLLTTAEVAALGTIAGRVIDHFAGEVPAELPPRGDLDMAWPRYRAACSLPGSSSRCRAADMLRIGRSRRYSGSPADRQQPDRPVVTITRWKAAP
jgi:hypothetical protein